VKGRDLDILVEKTGLKRKSIVNWLSVQRKKIDKENEPPRKKTCIYTFFLKGHHSFY